jgi:hypothetical protein
MTQRSESEVNAHPAPEVSAAHVRAVQQRIQSLVREHAEAMVLDMIEHVKDGNYLAMKFLFEMAGLFPASAPSEASEADTLRSRLDNFYHSLLDQKGTTEGSHSKPPALP